MVKHLLLLCTLLQGIALSAQTPNTFHLLSQPGLRIENAVLNNNAITFSGTSESFAELPHTPALNAEQGTWQFSVNIPKASTGHGQSILSKTDAISSYGGIHVYEDSERIALQVKSYNNSVTLTLKGRRIAGNGTHRIVMTYVNFSTVRLYVDGMLDVEGRAPYFLFCDAPVRAGCSLDTFWKPLAGTVSDIDLSTVVKSAEQIRGEYAATHPQILPIQVLPNPTQNQLNVTLPENDTITWQLCNAGGKPVLEASCSGITFSVNTESLAPGTYYLMVEGKVKYATQKIVIAR